MPERIEAAPHKGGGSFWAKVRMWAWVAAVALLWHASLAATTGLPFSQPQATLNALLYGTIGILFPVAGKPASPVAVNGHPAGDWGWPVAVFALLLAALYGAYLGWIILAKRLRGRSAKGEGEHGLSTAKQMNERIIGGEDPTLAPAAYRQGGVPIAVRTEDTGCTIAPPRWGKTAFMAAGMVADAPGAVITTSTRPDVLRVTAGIRSAIEGGTVYVADFDGLSQWPEKLRWDMVAGCEDSQVAEEMAAAMVNAKPGKGMGDMDGTERYFRTGCITILQGFLHAAALKGGSMRDVVAWSQNFRDNEPANIIRDKSPNVRPWAAALDQWCRQDNPDTIGNTRTTLATIIAPMLKEEVLSQLCAAEDDPGIDIEAFTDAPNTLYCIVRKSMTASTAPIATALVERINQHAIRRSGRTLTGRLDTHLSVVLDEAANTCPLPSLPSLMTEGGGNGIHTQAFFQSPSQVESRWGNEGEEIFDAAGAKTIFGGISDEKFLEKISALIGQHWVEHVSTSSSRGNDGLPTLNTTAQMQLDRKMRVDEIRKLPRGKVLLMYREIEAVVDVVPWWERPDAADFRASREWCLEREGLTRAEAEEAAAAEDEAEQLAGEAA
ncbi:TraM recognition domain-containing protein [Sinomonas sp. JGH33]|uniref:TraM recognition domain-containing protein n=1 Tax=Sinomonas terricola TaxID=3110330 RepID=A0ABU5TB89_9MICC|nr:TraM recognition domain-containing protein [Sinomonas sp. JGH33]MEA5456960.1 TraM recognition domain-containing protein [Sinomonas sp. JGH33]